MFNLETKLFKRKSVFHITVTLKSELDKALVSRPGHEILVRPRVVTREDTSVQDPEYGRSEPIESIQPGEQLVLKIKVTEEDLGGPGDYTLSYGVVQEFVKWYEPLAEVELIVKAPVADEIVEEAAVVPGEIEEGPGVYLEKDEKEGDE